MQYNSPTSLKTGVFIDTSNIIMNGGSGMRYDVLRKFASLDGVHHLLRLNAYVSYDRERAKTDEAYRIKQENIHAAMRDWGYKVIIKNVHWYEDDDGSMKAKSNVDTDLAVDMLTQSENLDRVMLLTGDGDFVQVIRALQNKGCRVEVVAFNNVSGALKREADSFVSGYLIPNLLPIRRQVGNKEWGQLESYVRGICYMYKPMENFGFLRYLHKLDGDLWRTDYHDERTPYSTAFFHNSEINDTSFDFNRMTHRKHIMEFKITTGQEEGQTKAVDIDIISGWS